MEKRAKELYDLGRTQYESGNANCISTLKDSLLLTRQTSDHSGSALCCFYIGSAYIDIPSLSNLEEAEVWLYRAQKLFKDDILGRAGCFVKLGDVSIRRFENEVEAGASEKKQPHHLNKAKELYDKALALTPPDSFDHKASVHYGLGNIHTLMKEIDIAMTHYQEALKCIEEFGDRYRAGIFRYQIAISLVKAGYYRKAYDYATAAASDFEIFGRRAEPMKNEVEKLIGYLKDF